MPRRTLDVIWGKEAGGHMEGAEPRSAVKMPGVPADGVLPRARPVTRSELLAGLRALGVRPGGILMVHTRMSALGWVVGDSQAIVEALLAALGPGGTLMAYAGWEDHPWHLAEWPTECSRAYRAELPPFDPELSEAVVRATRR